MDLWMSLAVTAHPLCTPRTMLAPQDNVWSAWLISSDNDLGEARTRLKDDIGVQRKASSRRQGSFSPPECPSGHWKFIAC
mmetsp:Transcript_30986/g.55484  ORF Transcript_30986/g.55484 Transcript_30986/m.55484 type:complete len:80 (-) Transcript_30986:409-648(-)